MSRSVRFPCEKPVPVCPTVRQRVLLFSDPLKHRPLGMYALSYEMLRCFKGSSLTVVRSCFYPKERFTLEPANMIELSNVLEIYSPTVGEKRKDVPVHFMHPWHE
jgi:hypothetical protein